MRASSVALVAVLGAQSLGALALDVVPGPPPRPEPPGRMIGVRTFGSVEGLPQLTVYALAQDAEGYVYAGTQDGLARYDGRRFERVPLPGTPHDAVNQLLAERAHLWVGTGESGLLLRTRAGWREVRAGGASLGAVEALTRSRAPERIWAGTPKGLYDCTVDTCALVPESAGLEVAELLEGEGPNGPCLWVGTNLDGLYRFDHSGAGLVRSDFHLGRDEGLPNDAVRALAEFGREAGKPVLWIGSGRGLARLAGDRLVQYGIAQGFPQGAVTSLAVRIDRAGEPVMLATTYGGGLVELDAQGEYRVLTQRDGLSDPFAWSLLVTGRDADAVTWIGSASAGVLRLEPGRFRTFDERDGLPQRGVVGVGEADLDGNGAALWIGTLGGAVRLVDGRFVPFLPPRLAQAVVYDILRDTRGRLWLGTMRGLVQLDGDTIREFSVDNSPLPALAADSLVWHDDEAGGTLWVGTGHGIARWRDGRLEAPFEADPVLGLLAVRAMRDVTDAGGKRRLVLGTSNGLMEIRGDAVVPMPVACLPHDEVVALAPGAAGELWAGTYHGAMRVKLAADGSAPCEALAEPADVARVVYAIARDRDGRIYLFGYDGVRRLARPNNPLDDLAALGYERYGLEDGLPSLEFNRDATVDARGRVWVANSAGLVGFDPAQQGRVHEAAPLRVDARAGDAPLVRGATLPAAHGELAFSFALLSFRDESRIRYRTQLVGLDASPGPWTRSAERRYSRLPPGSYVFRVAARDAAGVASPPQEVPFSIAPAWWQRHDLQAAAVLAAIALGFGLARWRTRAIARRAAALETEVRERTRALAAANEKLEQASNTDPLTGAWNRRWFYAHVAAWAAQAEHAGGLLLALVDIDHFKAINDRYGHAAGDTVLVEVAHRLSELARPHGEVIRWGGEEFLVVVRATGAIAVGRSVRAMLEAIASERIVSGEDALRVRASIGFTICLPPVTGVAEHIDQIVARADRALYRAKETGRARAVGAEIDRQTGELNLREVAAL